jgi:hypothetical protein
MSSSKTAKPEGAKSGTRSEPKYIGTAIALIATGGAGAWIASEISDTTYTPAVGVSVFALLYVLAQGVERVVEVVVAVVDALTGENSFAETRKRKALERLQAADAAPASDAESGPDAEAAKNEVERARADLTVFTQGLSFALSIVAVGYAHYGVLANIGVANVDAPVDRFVTALAVMGVSKGLHDLISKVQKSKENDEAGK